MLKRYKFVMCSYNYPSFFLGIRSKRLRERLRKIEGGENNMFMDHRIKVGVIPTRRVDMSFALDRALYYKDLVFKKLDEFGVEYVTVYEPYSEERRKKDRERVKTNGFPTKK